jgi:formate/nitrite transporter FocA (FNT family)
MPPKEHPPSHANGHQGASGSAGERASGLASHAEALTQQEREAVENGARLRAPVVYAMLRQEGTEELDRPTGSLIWSGVAAGLAMGFSLITEGVLKSHLPDTDWSPLVASFGYSVGFLIVIMGRQQLFTENTLTAFAPVLSRESGHGLPSMLRLWGIVFVANMVGTCIIAGAIYANVLFPPEANHVFREISHHLIERGWWDIGLSAIVAGWLVATLVWLLPSAGTAAPLIIFLITWLIRILELPHIVAGSVEVFLMGWEGAAAWPTLALHVLLPAFVGNVIGGSALFAMISYGQVRQEN